MQSVPLSLFLLCALATAVPITSAREYFGLMDYRGKFVMPCEYGEIRPASEGRFIITPIKSGEPSFEDEYVVDSHGEQISNVRPTPRFTRKDLLVREFKNYRAVCQGGSWALQCPDGRLIFQRTLSEPKPFPIGENLFAIQEAFTLTLVREDGKALCELPNLIRVGDSFCEQLLRVKDPNGFVGFIDPKGQVAIPPADIRSASDFSDGLAAVQKISKAGITSGAFIDRTGTVVLGPFEHVLVSPMKSGLAVVSKLEGQRYRYGAINSAGKFVIPLQYDAISQRENCVLVRDTGQWLAFSPDGTPQITFPREVKSIGEASDNGWFPVSCASGNSVKDLYGYYDQSGRMVIEPKFAYAGPFQHGVAVASPVGKHVPDTDIPLQGLINTSGSFVVKPKYRIMRGTGMDTFIVSAERGDPFDPFLWKDQDSFRCDRWVLWKRFLRAYDLIGMDRAMLVSLLGDPGSRNVTESDGYADRQNSITARDTAAFSGGTTLSYWINSPWCGVGSVGVQLYLDESNKVRAWRFKYDSQCSEWIDSDVVCSSKSIPTAATAKVPLGLELKSR